MSSTSQDQIVEAPLPPVPVVMTTSSPPPPLPAQMTTQTITTTTTTTHPRPVHIRTSPIVHHYPSANFSQDKKPTTTSIPVENIKEQDDILHAIDAKYLWQNRVNKSFRTLQLLFLWITFALLLWGVKPTVVINSVGSAADWAVQRGIIVNGVFGGVAILVTAFEFSRPSFAFRPLILVVDMICFGVLAWITHDLLALGFTYRYLLPMGAYNASVVFGMFSSLYSSSHHTKPLY